VLTYGGPDKHGTASVTYGGYSKSVAVDEHFVLRNPDNLDLAGAAPLLCAGITTHSPFPAAPFLRLAPQRQPLMGLAQKVTLTSQSSTRMTLGFVLVRVNSWILFIVRRQNLSTKLHELTRTVTFCAKPWD
jgi:hypothetical protein